MSDNILSIHAYTFMSMFTNQKLNALHTFLAGAQFMTYNLHQLLHLRDCVEDLGPLWSHSCFFFEDLNGDFRDLFHGTQNIDGQVRV